MTIQPPPAKLPASETLVSSIEISSIADLRALQSQWHNLWLLTPAATPFQSPHWLLPWWEFFSKPEFCALAVRRDSELIGLAIFQPWFDPEIQKRKLLLMGTGISDILGICYHPEFKAQIISAIREFIRQKANQWDLLDFQQLSADSPLLSLYPDANPEPQVPCPALPLSSTFESSVPRHMLEKFHYYLRRAQKLGRISFHRANKEEVHPTMQTLFHLHSARWREQGGPGVLTERTIQQFHLAVARRFSEHDMLRLYTLQVNGQTIAALYAFKTASTTFYYLSGFNPEFSKLSPGTLIIGHAIQEAIHERCATFNFLRGQENYKYSWGSRDAPCFQLLRHGACNLLQSALD
jgi:CelD/BcsL family acetyltransferase involved in cellulose biosynthesis